MEITSVLDKSDGTLIRFTVRPKTLKNGLLSFDNFVKNVRVPTNYVPLAIYPLLEAFLLC